MKIALSGSAGCGKTTLTEAIAARLGIALVPELHDGFFDHQGVHIPRDQMLARRIDEVLETKRRLELQAGNFVTDRCPLDLFYKWLVNGFSSDAADTKVLAEKCRHYVHHYDAVILPPWGLIPLEQLDPAETRRQRFLNPWIQFESHCLILGIALHWLPARKVIVIPPRPRTPEEQLEAVLNTCRERGLGTGT